MRRNRTQQYDALGDSQALDLIGRVHRRAEDYGIEDESDVVRFVSLAFGFGESFDRDEPWAREILNLPDLTAGERMHLLTQAAIEETAAEDEG
jgi:hypothetical protein